MSGIKAFFTVFLPLMLLFAFSTLAHSADTFSVTVPAGTEVTMQNPNSVIPATVTNNAGSTKVIRQITFKVDTSKYTISAATVPPAGWCVKDVGDNEITFALLQASGSCSNGSTCSEIAPGSSLVFNITVLPASAASDVPGDTFSSVTVDSQGGFSLSGPLPSWTRRSLEAALSAAPSFVGPGGEITLTMQVTNRSTATQGPITSSPSPPSASSAIVTPIAGPFYGSTALASTLTITATTVDVASASEFPSSGTVRIDSEDICYTGKTATTLTGATRGCNSTAADVHSSGALVYGLTQFSLAPGQTGSLIWKYRADLDGSVYFTSRASNGGGTARSTSVNSNTVTIGSFTSGLSISPVTVISGQNITVRMTVSNNGTSALVNVTPSALSGCAGGAAESLVSGPAPAGISTLAPGSSGVFYWAYSITGSIGQSYCLSGYASANGPVSTNTSTSNAGTVSSYSATVAPSVIPSGAVNQAFTWTVYNGSGCPVKEVEIALPGGSWSCSTVAPPSGWTASCGTGKVDFTSIGSSNDIPSGGTKSFSITFGTTETVTSDKAVPFTVRPKPRSGCGGSEGEIGTTVTVAANALALTHSPAGPVYADGSASYTMTATLTNNGVPVAGKTLTFSTSNGSLSAATATTDANGQASVTLTAPNSTTDTSASVTVSYFSSAGTDTVNFTGWTKANMQYWGGFAPVSVDCGSNETFTMTLRNVSSTSMTLGSGSYFSFNDSASGGSSVFMAYIDSPPVTISAGTERPVTFGSSTAAGLGGGVTVSSGFLAGSYKPLANATPPPASGLFLTDGGTNDQYRSVTDNITVGGGCGSVNVNIIEWQEVR